MDILSVNKFRDNLKSSVEQVISRHEPLKVTRRAGDRRQFSSFQFADGSLIHNL